METAWMDEQFVISFYQTCLTFLVWLLATFTCLGVLTAAAMVCQECRLFSASAGRASKPAARTGVQEAARRMHAS